MERQKHIAAFVTTSAVMAIAGLIGTQPERAAAQSSAGLFAYVGSFTTAQRKARGDGIHVYRVDPASGAWTHVQHIGDLINPSFLALSPDQPVLYYTRFTAMKSTPPPSRSTAPAARPSCSTVPPPAARTACVKQSIPAASS